MRWRSVLALIVFVLGTLAATNPGEAVFRVAMAAELGRTPPPRIVRTNYFIFSVYRVEIYAPPAPAERRCILGAGGQFIPLRRC